MPESTIAPLTQSYSPNPDTLILTKADAAPETRFQRTLIGLGGAYAVMMAAHDCMPTELAKRTQVPQALVDQLRCGAGVAVSVEQLCVLADALGCDVQVTLRQRG